MGKFLTFMVFKIIGNALNLGVFTHAPLPSQNSPRSFYHHTLGRGKLLILPGSIFSKICFPQRQKVMEKTMIQSENIKMSWNINLFVFGMICIFSNVMVF